MQDPRPHDRLEIDGVLTNYTYGLDDRSLARFLGAFHVDASLLLDGETLSGHDALTRGVEKVWQATSSTVHMTTGYVLIFSGDNLATGYGRGIAYSVQLDGSLEYAAGRYEDRLERRDGVWRLAHRSVLLDQRMKLAVAPSSGR